jgi:hypothetical protein
LLMRCGIGTGRDGGSGGGSDGDGSGQETGLADVFAGRMGSRGGVEAELGNSRVEDV